MAKCTRCHRALKDKTSIDRGFGPVCWAKVQAELTKEEAAPEGHYDGGDIVLKRVNGYATANVPHAIKYHSPTGFEWGYGGSGPADLALNILYAVTGDRKIAMEYHQEFKWDFIAGMPEEGGIIKRSEIIEWLRKKGYKVA